MLFTRYNDIKLSIKINFSDSGGDIEVVVASLQEHEISPIREAFQSVFGKATIS